MSSDNDIQSAENRRKECHRFWLRLRHAVILILNVRTSASKKINGMALIRTLTVLNTAFERTKKKFYGFPQTVLLTSEISGYSGFLLQGGGEQGAPPKATFAPLKFSKTIERTIETIAYWF